MRGPFLLVIYAEISATFRLLGLFDFCRTLKGSVFFSMGHFQKIQRKTPYDWFFCNFSKFWKIYWIFPEGIFSKFRKIGKKKHRLAICAIDFFVWCFTLYLKKHRFFRKKKNAQKTVFSQTLGIFRATATLLKTWWKRFGKVIIVFGKKYQSFSVFYSI